MELEEMKNAWLALGEKLDRKQKLSTLLIREMYQTKVKKSLSVLLGYEVLSVAVCLLILPFIAWLASTMWDLLSRIILIYWSLYSVGAVIWCSKKTILLMKVDETGSVKDNIKRINTYGVWIHKEKKYFTFFALIGVIPMFVVYWLYAKPWHWIFMIAILVLAALTTLWSYKRLYDRNIRIIQQNLDELNDLKE